MKEFVLSNSKARAAFSLKGAELTSFLLDGKEYIWQAHPAVWNRHAPVLFPTVGRLLEDTYLVKGKAYHLSQHGFARDREFTLISQSETSITFILKSDQDTLKAYPFSFRLYISYTLKGQALQVKYEVKNTSTEYMLFSIGGHPAFNCPLNPEEEDFEDYELNFFDGSSIKEIYQLDGSFLGKDKGTLSLHKGKLDLSYSLFEDDALIIDSKKPYKISLMSRKTGKGVVMEYEDFNWLGIWTKGKGAGFICLEPWNGIADPADHDQDFEEKIGINSLPPQGTYEVKYLMEFL